MMMAGRYFCSAESIIPVRWNGKQTGRQHTWGKRRLLTLEPALPKKEVGGGDAHRKNRNARTR